MRRQWIVLGVAAGVACFVLGVLAARWLGQPAAPPSPSGGFSLFPVRDAGAGPRVFVDPDSIKLLPDASLQLELPEEADAAAPP